MLVILLHELRDWNSMCLLSTLRFHHIGPPITLEVKEQIIMMRSFVCSGNSRVNDCTFLSTIMIYCMCINKPIEVFFFTSMSINMFFK